MALVMKKNVSFDPEDIGLFGSDGIVLPPNKFANLIQELLGRFLIWRVGIQWWLFVLVFPAIPAVGALYLFNLFGGPAAVDAHCTIWVNTTQEFVLPSP